MKKRASARFFFARHMQHWSRRHGLADAIGVHEAAAMMSIDILGGRAVALGIGLLVDIASNRTMRPRMAKIS
jgi:hypothetical protein